MRASLLASDIADRLKELRAVMGWRQADLGRELGRSGAAVLRWENGQQGVDEGLLYALAGRYGWPLTIFQEGGPRPGAVLPGAGRIPSVGLERPVPAEAVLRALVGLVNLAYNYGREGRDIPWRVVGDWVSDTTHALGLAPPGPTGSAGGGTAGGTAHGMGAVTARSAPPP